MQGVVGRSLELEPCYEIVGYLGSFNKRLLALVEKLQTSAHPSLDGEDLRDVLSHTFHGSLICKTLSLERCYRHLRLSEGLLQRLHGVHSALLRLLNLATLLGYSICRHVRCARQKVENSNQPTLGLLQQSSGRFEGCSKIFTYGGELALNVMLPFLLQLLIGRWAQVQTERSECSPDPEGYV